jgi:hypothetical protein
MDAMHVDEVCMQAAPNAKSFRITMNLERYNRHKTTYPNKKHGDEEEP